MGNYRCLDHYKRNLFYGFASIGLLPNINGDFIVQTLSIIYILHAAT
jgi:hypothetical protein